MYMKTQGFSLPGSALFYLASAQNGICGKLLSFHQISFSGDAYIRMAQIDPHQMMVRRTTICALAAVMALCVASPVSSRAQSSSDKCAIVWLADTQSKKAVECEALTGNSSLRRSETYLPQALSPTLYFLTNTVDGRAPPRILTAD